MPSVSPWNHEGAGGAGGYRAHERQRWALNRGSRDLPGGHTAARRVSRAFLEAESCSPIHPSLQLAPVCPPTRPSIRPDPHSSTHPLPTQPSVIRPFVPWSMPYPPRISPSCHPPVGQSGSQGQWHWRPGAQAAGGGASRGRRAVGSRPGRVSGVRGHRKLRACASHRMRAGTWSRKMPSAPLRCSE